MKTLYDYGLSKIYELVINSDPCYAFLLETNTILQNKFVVAHVLGHSDFFKHNAYFSGTSHDMPELVIEHARRIRQYAQDVGEDEVEAFLDAVLSIADHVDPYPERGSGSLRSEEGDPPRGLVSRQRPYDDLFPRDGPPDTGRGGRGRRRVPTESEADLLRFLAAHGDHFEEWQRDILDIVRQETLYFVPQMHVIGSIETNPGGPPLCRQPRQGRSRLASDEQGVTSTSAGTRTSERGQREVSDVKSWMK